MMNCQHFLDKNDFLHVWSIPILHINSVRLHSRLILFTCPLLTIFGSAFIYKFLQETLLWIPFIKFLICSTLPTLIVAIIKRWLPLLWMQLVIIAHIISIWLLSAFLSYCYFPILKCISEDLISSPCYSPSVYVQLRVVRSVSSHWGGLYKRR